MKYIPHKYQTSATDFIISHEIAALFLDMGLGKSVITLTAIKKLFEMNKIRRVLIIAPLRVAFDTWPNEIKKWDHLNSLDYAVAVGTAGKRMKALESRAAITIINRENVDWLVNKSGFDFDFDMIVIDELSSFKNHKTARFKSLTKVRPYCSRIVGLTGTPASNGLMDLYAEFRILDMGKRLGRYIGNYRNTYFVPDKRNAQIVFSYKPLPWAENAIYSKISDITISMKSCDFSDMPECIFNDVKVNMSASERKLYNDFKKTMVIENSDITVTASNAAVLSGKLQQLANGCIYSDDRSVSEIHHCKLDALEDIIEAANGKSVLVAYWFKHDLARITERLHKIGVDFQNISSPQSIRNWNEGKTQVGLIHPASAGHGLNLQSGGNILVWFGLTWSLELYQQTNARLWRQGQERTVIIEHLVCADTIDENILTALKSKTNIQDRLIQAVSAELKGE